MSRSETKQNHTKKHESSQIKNLVIINQSARILREGKPVEETMLQLCHFLPKAWQSAENVAVRIKYRNKKYVTPGFKKTSWGLAEEFRTQNNFKGAIEIFYQRKLSKSNDDTFTEQEQHLLKTLSNLLQNYFNKSQSSNMEEKSPLTNVDKEKSDKSDHIINRKLLQKFLYKQDSERDIYHDLMPFKVREILLVANLYEAFSLEKEGQFTDQIFGPFQTS